MLSWRNWPRTPDDQLGEIDHFLVKTSANIRQLALNHLIPTSHLRDWIWIGSRFRLSAEEKSSAWPLCKGALIFLSKNIQRAGTAIEQFQTDFNWVADKTVSELVGLYGAKSYDQFMSPAELDAVKVRLAELRRDTADLSRHERDGIAEYTAWLSDISSETYLPGIAQMVDGIKIHIDAPNPVHRSSAIACLRYVLEKQDVIPGRPWLFGFGGRHLCHRSDLQEFKSPKRLSTSGRVAPRRAALPRPNFISTLSECDSF